MIRRSLLCRLAVPLLCTALAGGAFALSIAVPGVAQAQTIASFAMSDDDGYGVDACLDGGESCGHAVANAWCIANGYERSVSLRATDATDVTGSLTGPTQVAARESHGVVISCER